MEKRRSEEFYFLERLASRATVLSMRHYAEMYPDRPERLICATLDFYIGFVYDLIGLQVDHYLPVRTMSRMVGWLAHRNEELHATTRRPIHPSYLSLQTEPHIYIPLNERSA
jgi:citrate synthase